MSTVDKEGVISIGMQKAYEAPYKSIGRLQPFPMIVYLNIKSVVTIPKLLTTNALKPARNEVL